jgi:hypothetical protein
MAELLGTLGWSGFSLRERRTGVSSLMRLQRGEAAFAPGFHLEEAFARSTTPAFSPEGFARPDAVALVDAGRLPAIGGTLNSPRSAAEIRRAGHRRAWWRVTRGIAPARRRHP